MPFGKLNLGLGLGSTGNSSIPIGPDTTVQSAWAGAVTDTTFAAAHYLGADSSGTRLAVSVNSDMSSPVYSSRARNSSSKTIKHTITGLTANTAYYFGIEVNGVVKTTKKGRFKTMPAGASSGSQISFRFSVYQCQSGVNNGKSLDQIRALATKPLFNIINGDIHYDDIGTNDEALFDASLEGVLGGTYSGPFIREIPQYYMFDDHDYGPNDSDSTSASRTASLAVFRRRAPNPAGPYSGATEPVNYSFVQGRLRFIVTDTRSQKDTVTILGTAQKAWFAAQLAAAYSAGQFVCWVSPAPWNGRGWSDGWNRTVAIDAERREVGTLIVDAGMGGRCFVIAGDAHAIQIDNGTNGDFAHGSGLRMPMITASAAYAGTGLALGEPFSEGAGITTKTSQVGYFDVTDNGASGLSIAFTGIGMDSGDVSATELATYTFTLPKAAPAAPSGVSLVQEYHEHILQSVTSNPITLRAAPTQGNLLLMNVVLHPNGGASLSVPGWTKIGTDMSSGSRLFTTTYYKVADASESATITLTLGGARDIMVSVFEFSGADTSSPVDQDIKDNQDSGAVNGVSMAYTTANDNEWAIAFVSIDNGGNVTGARAWSSGVVERAYPDPLGPPGYAVGSKQLGAAGAGTITFDYTGTADQMHGRLITLKPATSVASTAQGRRSSINLMMPWRAPLVVPDGSINQNDRQQLVYSYSEIAA